MIFYIILFSVILLLLATFYTYNYLYNNPIVVFVDGNIGAGKSTLIQMMELQYRQYYYVTEPINMWKGWKLSDEILTNANHINCKNISTIIILCILS